MEQFIKEATQEFMQAIDYSFVDALSDLIAKSYNKGFEDCKKFYGINNNKAITIHNAGGCTTITGVYNGKSKNKVKVG